MNRRKFLAFLAYISFVSYFLPKVKAEKPKEIVKEGWTARIMRHPAVDWILHPKQIYLFKDRVVLKFEGTVDEITAELKDLHYYVRYQSVVMVKNPNAQFGDVQFAYVGCLESSTVLPRYGLGGGQWKNRDGIWNAYITLTNGVYFGKIVHEVYGGNDEYEEYQAWRARTLEENHK